MVAGTVEQERVTYVFNGYTNGIIIQWMERWNTKLLSTIKCISVYFDMNYDLQFKIYDNRNAYNYSTTFPQK